MFQLKLTFCLLTIGQKGFFLLILGQKILQAVKSTRPVSREGLSNLGLGSRADMLFMLLCKVNMRTQHQAFQTDLPSSSSLPATSQGSSRSRGRSHCQGASSDHGSVTAALNFYCCFERGRQRSRRKLSKHSLMKTQTAAVTAPHTGGSSLP